MLSNLKAAPKKGISKRWQGFVYLLVLTSLFFMITIIVTNVLCRKFLKTSITGTIEIVGLCNLIFVSSALAFSVRDQANVKIDFLYERLRRGKRFVHTFSILSSMFAISALVYANTIRSFQSFIIGESSQILTHIPLYPFRFFFIITLFFILFFLSRELIYKGKKVS